MSQHEPQEIVLWGGTGQAKLVRPILERQGKRIIAVIDDTVGLQSPFDNVPVCLGLKGFQQWLGQRDGCSLGFVITIGNPHGSTRLRLAGQLQALGLHVVNVIHDRAIVEDHVQLGLGVQILAGAQLGPEVKVGQQCIINANASVDHECVLEDGSEIAPGATLCGLVHVGNCAWVGAGATILPRIRIGAHAIVGAGAVVTKDVPEGVTVVGVPAQVLSR